MAKLCLKFLRLRKPGFAVDVDKEEWTYRRWTYQSFRRCGCYWTLPSVCPSLQAAGSGTAAWLGWMSRRCPQETAWRCYRTGTSCPSCAGSGYLHGRQSAAKKMTNVFRMVDLKMWKFIRKSFSSVLICICVVKQLPLAVLWWKTINLNFQILMILRLRAYWLLKGFKTT